MDGLQRSPFGVQAAQAHAERVLLELLALHQAEGRRVSPHVTSNNYAPTVFAKDYRAEGITRTGFEAALDRLFAAGRVEVSKTDGPPSRQVEILVPKEPRQ